MKLLFALLLAISLNAAGFWTLTGLDKANVYVSNELSLIKPETIVEIKKIMSQKLEVNGIKTKLQDSPTLMISLQELENDETFYIYVKLALGEEVQTFRADKSETFALTYAANDFIEVDLEDMDRDILESVNFLLSQFFEQYEDDRE